MAEEGSSSFQNTVSDMANSAAAAGDPKTTGWNTKKFMEEYDLQKLRLSDQKFNIRTWPRANSVHCTTTG